MKSLKYLFIILSILLVGCTEDNIFNQKGDEKTLFAESDFVYCKNYVDSLDALFCKDGYAVLFGNQEMSLYDDSISTIERVIYVTKVDYKKKKFDTSDLTAIVLDSINCPSLIVNKNYSIMAFHDNDSIQGFLVTDLKTGESREANIKMPLKIQQNSRSRALSEGGYDSINLANILTALSITNNSSNLLSGAGYIEKLNGGIGLFGDAAGLLGNDELGTLIGLRYAGSPAGAGMVLLGYVGSKIKNLVLKDLGNTRMSISDVKQTDPNSIELSYVINNLSEHTRIGCSLYANIVKYEGLRITRREIPLKLHSGGITTTISNLSPGQYSIDLWLRSNKFPAIQYYTQPLVRFEIVDIALDSYNINDVWYNDSYGYVEYDISLKLSGNLNGLKDIKEYGVVISPPNGRNNYYRFYNGSLTRDIKLQLYYSDFTEKDFNTFKAEATRHIIDAYWIDSRGNFHLVGGQALKGLSYSNRPEVKLLKVLSYEYSPHSWDNTPEGRVATLTFTYEVKGEFWGPVSIVPSCDGSHVMDKRRTQLYTGKSSEYNLYKNTMYLNMYEHKQFQLVCYMPLSNGSIIRSPTVINCDWTGETPKFAIASP